jgi:hypothetical protein
MYKIISITDRDGNVKEEFIKELEVAHPNMTGQLLYPITKEVVGMIRMCFIWADRSNKVLRTSIVEGYQETSELLKVITENSIYILEKVKN